MSGTWSFHPERSDAERALAECRGRGRIIACGLGWVVLIGEWEEER